MINNTKYRFNTIDLKLVIFSKELILKFNYLDKVMYYNIIIKVT